MKQFLYILAIFFFTASFFEANAKPQKQNKSCVNPKKLILPGDNYKGKKCANPRKIKHAKYY